MRPGCPLQVKPDSRLKNIYGERVSTNATATATSSTTFTGNSWRPKAWCSTASLQMSLWRSLSSQGIRYRHAISSGLSPDPIAPILFKDSSPPREEFPAEKYKNIELGE